MFLDFILDPNIFNILNIILIVLAILMIPGSAAIVWTCIMYFYGRYKKWKNHEDKEAEKILLKRAKTITESDEEIARQIKQKHELEEQVDVLKYKKKVLQDEVRELKGEPTEDDESDDTIIESIDLSTLTVLQLRPIAEELGIARFSKLKKAQLIEKLQGVEIPGELIKKLALSDDSK